LISDNISFYKEVGENKNIAIAMHNYNPFMVFADYNMINTVVRNLLNNAIKFTPENGKVDIYLSENEEFISCAIKDTGIGIEPDLLKQLFEIDKTVSTNGTIGESGTGLGLIICHDFITHNDGKIWAESVVNNGTSFYFSIPRAK
jgi:signal transduction histidine kinase